MAITPMRVLFPTTITASKVIATSAAQLLAGQTLWSSTAAYAVDAVVLNGTAADASVYKCIAAVSAAASNPSPAQDKAHWTRVAPGNRWAMFDKSVNTRTTLDAGWSVRLTGVDTGCDGLALVDLMGVTSLTVTVTRPKTADMAVSAAVTSTYAEDITVTKLVSPTEQRWVFDVSLTNALSTAVDLGYIPPSLAVKTDVALQWPPGKTWTIEVSGTQAGSIGSMVVGNFIELGDVDKDDLSSTADDYSRVEVDEFGIAELTPRPYYRSVSCSLLVTHERVRFVHAVLMGLRATAAFFVASDDYRYSPFNTWGHVERFVLGTRSGVYCQGSLSIKGISQ